MTDENKPKLNPDAKPSNPDRNAHSSPPDQNPEQNEEHYVQSEQAKRDERLKRFRSARAISPGHSDAAGNPPRLHAKH